MMVVYVSQCVTTCGSEGREQASEMFDVMLKGKEHLCCKRRGVSLMMDNEPDAKRYWKAQYCEYTVGTNPVLPSTEGQVR